MSLLRNLFRKERRSSKKPPSEFEWVSVQMSVTTWALTGMGGVIAVGVWTGAMQLIDLAYEMEHMQDRGKKQIIVDDAQNKSIATLEVTMGRHSVLLEQINEIVKETNRAVRGK